MADRTPEWLVEITRPPSLMELAVALASTGIPRQYTRYTKRKAKPAPSTPTSKRAKVKAARKQRQRNG